MKFSMLILPLLVSLPAAASPQNLKACQGSFMISSSPASQAMVESFLAGSVRSNMIVVKTIGSGASKIYQVQAANAGSVDSATAVMDTLAQLDGVIVECDSELGQ